MYRLKIYNRFGSKSSIYFDICRESWKQYEENLSKLKFPESASDYPSKKTIEDLDKFEFYLIETDKYWSTAIVFGALCLEAFIYDYAATRFTDTYVRNYLDGLDFVAKWVIVPKLVTGKDFPTDTQAFEQLRKLRKERNELVHAKSKPMPSDEELGKMIEESTKENKSKVLNPYQAVIEALTELRNLDGDEIETRRWVIEEIK